MSADDTYRGTLAYLDTGSAVTSAALDSARHDRDELRDTVAALSAAQARAGLGFLAVMHSRQTRGGVRYLPEDPSIDAVIAAADAGGFSAVQAATGELLEPDAKAALANLAWTYRQQRADVAAAALKLN